ncbi:MAG: Hsp20/alpha crystallin family protein [Candidatus Riflebacteria bacterium]|nr:Hsp20/alpha crystallin family protein [Candidatus Riflebacteria bacterium]
MKRPWIWFLVLSVVVVAGLVPLMIRAEEQDQASGAVTLQPKSTADQPPASIEDMVRSMEEKMDKLMESPFRFGRFPRWFDDDFGFPLGGKRGSPAMGLWSGGSAARSNITQSGDHLVVTIDLPGHDKSAINLRLKDRSLILSSERKSVTKEDKDQKAFREEISYGSFSQVFELPRRVIASQAAATYDNGVLTVTLPIDPSTPPEEGIRIPIK